MKRKETLLLVILCIFIFTIDVLATYHFQTSIVPGAGDFYSRWHGARALLIEGRNPYALDVTEEIQPIVGFDPSEIGRGGFNYPLHVIFFFWPLVYLPYPWTQAIWLVTLQWLAIGSVIALLARLNWKPKPLAVVLLILMTLSFYPLFRSIFVGQFTIWILFILVLTLLFLKKDRDFIAGVIFSAASIKPQMVIFIAPWLVLWALGRKRWRFLGGLLSGGFLFLIASWMLYPGWPAKFIEDLQRYRRFAGGRNPIQLTLDYLWPEAPAFLLPVISGSLILTMLVCWWRNWQTSDENRFLHTLNWTIMVELLVTFQTGTTNQVLLLIPLFSALAASQQWKWKAFVPFAIAIFWGLTWMLFISTMVNKSENVIMFLPFLVIFLAGFLVQMLTNWYSARQSNTATEA